MRDADKSLDKLILSEAEVREIVREEIAAAFERIWDLLTWRVHTQPAPHPFGQEP